jgi:hypothetical protein
MQAATENASISNLLKRAGEVVHTKGTAIYIYIYIYTLFWSIDTTPLSGKQINQIIYKLRAPFRCHITGYTTIKKRTSIQTSNGSDQLYTS